MNSEETTNAVNTRKGVTAPDKYCYSIDSVAELYGLDRWTIRMWMNRFDMRGYTFTADGEIMFSMRTVERIGTVCRLVKKRMTLRDVREYLDSELSGYCCE